MQSASGVSTTHGEDLTYAGQILTYAERAFKRSVCGHSRAGETGEIGAEAIASFGAPTQQRNGECEALGSRVCRSGGLLADFRK